MAKTLAAVVLLVLALSGCAASGPWTLEFPGRLPADASNAAWIGSYEEVAANVAAVMQRDLGFPPFTASVQFFPDRRAFEAALLATGYDAALARQTATTMAAIGGYRSVLVNEQKLVPLSWVERLVLLAHELTHTFQYELGGGRRGASDQWLREGFAEWVSMRVLDRAGAAPADQYRRTRLRELRGTTRAKAPALAEMVTFPQFVALAERRNHVPYAYAFVAVDLMIERHGLPAVVRYFELFATSSDRAANFRAAFGEDLHEFEARLLARVWR